MDQLISTHKNMKANVYATHDQIITPIEHMKTFVLKWSRRLMNWRTIAFQSKRFPDATANATARAATTALIVIFIRWIVVNIYAITILAIWF